MSVDGTVLGPLTDSRTDSRQGATRRSSDTCTPRADDRSPFHDTDLSGRNRFLMLYDLLQLLHVDGWESRTTCLMVKDRFPELGSVLLRSRTIAHHGRLRVRMIYSRPCRLPEVCL